MDDVADRAPSPLDPPLVIENPTDSELVEAARTGDSFAITRLWQRHLSVAWRAARAATGRADAEPVVVRTAERLVAELGEARGPVGAVRPHLLALTRAAAADEMASPAASGPAVAEPAGEGAEPRPALQLAPVETYRDLLPDGLGDGSAVAAAFASLPVRWQEALWLTEVDGLTTPEVAAELGLTSDAADTVLADARSALRAEWSSLRLADLPDDADCRAAGGGSAPGRRGRSHLDDCPGCRVVTAAPEAVARRALGTLPILLLGAGGGIAFLESLRSGASAAATEPVPTLAETGAAAAEAEAAAAAAATATLEPRLVAAGMTGAFAAALNGARRRPAVIGAMLGGIAATTALVAALATWSGSPDDPSRFLAGAGSAADVAEPAPGMEPPVVIATDVPQGPLPDSPAPDSPGAAPDAAPDASPGPAPTADAAPPSEDAPGDGADDPAAETPDDTPANGPSAPANGGGQTPVYAPAPPTSPAPLQAELGKPGTNGWRTLTVTGEAGAAFTVSSGGRLLFSGVLDAGGEAELQVRGLAGGVDSLTLAYGTASGTSYALTEAPGELETSKRSAGSSPPAP